MIIQLKRLLLFILILQIIACEPNSKSDKVTASVDTLSIKAKDSIATTDKKTERMFVDSSYSNEESATYYLVQVAAGHNYDSLYKIAEEAARILHSEINTLGRIYKINKGIALPDDCDDDIYCGEYYPRRPFVDQNFVSIEMQYAYYDDTKAWEDRDTLQMIVLANMFGSEAKADSVVDILKGKFKNAEAIRQDLYTGCMH